MEQRLSMISLGVADLGRARDFYESGLGWVPAPSSTDTIVFYPLNSILLGLYSRVGLAEDAGIPHEGSGFRGIALAYNTRSREEVDTVLDQASTAGARIVKKAQDVFWGGYSGYFADHDGHLFEVAYNPFWTINSVGDVIMAQD